MKTRLLFVLSGIFLLSDISLAQMKSQGCAGYRLYPMDASCTSRFCVTNDTIMEGGIARFSVHFSSDCAPPSKYEWFRDGVLILNANSRGYSATLPGLYTVKIYGSDMGDDFLNKVNLIVTRSTGMGQNYYPMPRDSATWTVIRYADLLNPPFFSIGSLIYGLSGDTIIEGKLFSKMYLDSNPSGTIEPEKCFNRQTAGYVAAIREDSTKKVWVREAGDTIDRLYYDFALSAGDTFCFPRPQPASGRSCFEVVAVDSILIDGNYRKQIHFEDINGTEQWIEGIGSATDWFEPWSVFSNIEYYLECFSENQKLIYGDSSSCSCLGTDIKSSIKEEEIRIYPNPATSQLIVETPNLNGRKLVEIYSMLGQKVKSLIMENDVLTINISNLAEAEVFLVVVNDDEHHWTKRIMKNAP